MKNIPLCRALNTAFDGAAPAASTQHTSAAIIGQKEPAAPWKQKDDYGGSAKQ
jgi:hypothetical protein